MTNRDFSMKKILLTAIAGAMRQLFKKKALMSLGSFEGNGLETKLRTR